MHGTRDGQGLTPREARYCALVAQGYSQSDAFRTAFSASKLKSEQVHERACRLSRRPRIMARVRDLLSAVRLSDIDSVGQAIQRTLHALREAEVDRNWTAFAALNRQVLQMHNLLRDTLSLTSDPGFSDEILVKRLSGGDPVKERILRQMIGGDDFGATVDALGSGTKH